MKYRPKKYLERSNQLMHCEGPDGNDYTLCGFSLDGDQGDIGLSSGRITCPQCAAMIRFCRSLSVRLKVQP